MYNWAYGQSIHVASFFALAAYGFENIPRNYLLALLALLAFGVLSSSVGTIRSCPAFVLRLDNALRRRFAISAALAVFSANFLIFPNFSFMGLGASVASSLSTLELVVGRLRNSSDL